MDTLFEHWSGHGLKEHLENHHSVAKNDSVSASWGKSKLEGNTYVLKPENMMQQPEIKWQECSICLQTCQANLANTTLSQGQMIYYPPVDAFYSYNSTMA